MFEKVSLMVKMKKTAQLDRIETYCVSQYQLKRRFQVSMTFTRLHVGPVLQNTFYQQLIIIIHINKNNNSLIEFYKKTSTVVSTSHQLTHLITVTIFLGREYSYSHCISGNGSERLSNLFKCTQLVSSSLAPEALVFSSVLHH